MCYNIILNISKYAVKKTKVTIICILKQSYVQDKQ